jgi:hypothetical protein
MLNIQLSIDCPKKTLKGEQPKLWGTSPIDFIQIRWFLVLSGGGLDCVSSGERHLKLYKAQGELLGSSLLRSEGSRGS